MGAKRFGLREVSVHFGMFDYSMCCVVGPYTNVEKYIEWKFEDHGFETESPYECRGRVFYRPGYVPVLWIPRLPRTPREYGTLCHEVLHVVSHLMDWASIKFTGDTEEAYCHAVGHAVTEILSKLKRSNRA